MVENRELLRLLAAGLFAESRVAKGRFQYSPFPENNYPTDRFRAWNALIGGLVGYLAHVTGESRYADWVRECYDGIVEQSDDLQISMDMLHLAGWMLHAVVNQQRATHSKGFSI